MIDDQFWKKAYMGRWKEGLDRSKKILEVIESWGFSSEPFGFLATNREYDKTVPEEKGKPDWKIAITPSRNFIYLETTGTVRSRPPNDVWIRNDKFVYAENHADMECWVGHIVENENLIRFIKLENKDKYPWEYKPIRGIQERFRIVPEKEPNLLAADQFKSYLESQKI